MSRPSPHLPVKPFVGIITSAPALIDEVRPILCERLGEIDHESGLLDFDFTEYYETEMGRGLKRKFFSFSRLMNPEELPGLKLWTNELEARHAVEIPVGRPLAGRRTPGRDKRHAAVCGWGQVPALRDMAIPLDSAGTADGSVTCPPPRETSSLPTAPGVDATTCASRPATGRSINLDPGYVSLAKVVLATAKDFSHRIYLRHGIYAEITLKFGKGAFQPWPWTFPDYRQESYISFFNTIRATLKSVHDRA